MVKDIERVLAARSHEQIRDGNLIPAAVLLLLLEKNDEDHVLFTMRSNKVEHHKGEISFPGGRVDPHDASPLHAALREATEEIGLAAHDVTILGRLDDTQTTTTGFIITPYVGRIPYPYPFRINTDEIAELVFVPLQTLVEQPRVEASGPPHAAKRRSSYLFEYQGHAIWGATARILKQFLDITVPTKEGPDRDNGARSGITSTGR